MRKIALALMAGLIYSCGTPDGEGSTILVSLSTDKSLIQQDVLLRQQNSNNVCNVNVKPAPAVINLTVEVSPISKQITNPSPVEIYEIDLSYIPTKNNEPTLSVYKIYKPTVIKPNATATFSIPVASPSVIDNFFSLQTGGTNVNYEYYVNAKVKMKEIYFNKDITKNFSFTVSFQDILSQNECVP